MTYISTIFLFIFIFGHSIGPGRYYILPFVGEMHVTNVVHRRNKFVGKTASQRFCPPSLPRFYSLCAYGGSLPSVLSVVRLRDWRICALDPELPFVIPVILYDSEQFCRLVYQGTAYNVAEETGS